MQQAWPHTQNVLRSHNTPSFGTCWDALYVSRLCNVNFKLNRKLKAFLCMLHFLNLKSRKNWRPLTGVSMSSLTFSHKRHLCNLRPLFVVVDAYCFYKIIHSYFVMVYCWHFLYILVSLCWERLGLEFQIVLYIYRESKNQRPIRSY